MAPPKKYHSEAEKKAARREICRKWYVNNAEAGRAARNAYMKRKRKEYKDKYAQIKGDRGCLFCPEDNPKCLDWHHKDKSTKIESVAVLIANKVPEKVIENEIEKCVVLCANCHRKLHVSSYENVVFKGWGYEIWIVNNEKYCGKLLGVQRGKKCSWHYHKIKDEVFYLQSGRIIVRFSDGDDIEHAETIVMNKGESFHVPTGLRHQFQALKRSVIVEFSTHHEDADSIRIIPGD